MLCRLFAFILVMSKFRWWVGEVISVFPEGIYIFDGYGIFEMILRNPDVSIEYSLSYCSHQRTDN